MHNRTRAGAPLLVVRPFPHGTIDEVTMGQTRGEAPPLLGLFLRLLV